MITDLLHELNLLWEPIQPYLAREVAGLYGRQGGHVLEIGPFSGLTFTLARQNLGENFSIAAFPQGVAPLLRGEAKKLGLQDRVKIIDSDSSLAGVAEESVDLAVFRGALFFPSLFRVDFTAICRALKKEGLALIGGGFGKYTPREIIAPIEKRSQELNAQLGKVRIEGDDLLRELRSARLPVKTEVIKDGGLWILLRK